MLQLLKCLKATVLSELLGCGTRVELDEVEVVSLKPTQTLPNAITNSVSRVDVLAPTILGRFWIKRAPTLGRKEVPRATIADGSTDALLAQAVIDRRINVVHAHVKERVQDAFRIRLADVTPARRPAELHGAIAKHRYIHVGSSKSLCR